MACTRSRCSTAHPAGVEHGNESFEVRSACHRSILEKRGYIIERQANLDNHLVRNSPWKTYWLGVHDIHGPVFVKVNYGYSDEINHSMGDKEARLPEYFADRFRGGGRVKFPTVVESWQGADGCFVVFAREDMEERSGFAVLMDESWWREFVELLKAWEAVDQPDWWSNDHVLHDFALDQSYGEEPTQTSPFGFDLDDNLAILGDGKLLLYDFEFIQWSNPFLQSVYMAQKYLTESRKVFVETLRGKGPISMILGNARGRVSRNTVRQGLMVHRSKMERNGEMSPLRRVRGVLARRLVEQRTLAGVSP